MARVLGETAVVVLAAPAEPVVARSYGRHERVPPLGVPAHVTLLYPFLPRSEITAEVRARLGAVVAAEPAFDVAFRRFGRFPSVLWLDPEPADPFRRLTHALWEAWPQTPPYAGRFDDVTPHLTVAEHADDALLDAVAADVEPGLPVSMTVTEAALLAVGDGSWRPFAAFPLAAQPAIRSAPA
jgi:2'-5' RNA ligase